MQHRSELPAPDADALAHSRRVADRIRSAIRDGGGWVDFADFMDLALYAPGLGYYSAGAAKFGPTGDFVTAPEISPLFARCLARSCLPWLREHPRAVVLELGAGTGALAAEFLAALGRAGLGGVRYRILEISADLRARQRETLARVAAGRPPDVAWLDRLPDSPGPAIVLANEVADALPVSRFAMRAGAVRALGVGERGEGFGWAERAPSPALRCAVDAVIRENGAALPDGFTSEVSLRLPAWVRAVAACLDAGIFLVSDYGMSRREYYHRDRSDGTLACHYRHRVHGDPFFCPGLQDITASVDFTALAGAAEEAGLAVSGYATQAHFLLDTGFAEELSAADPAAIGKAKTLVLPGAMGERFKLLALTRGETPLAGFGFRDLRHLL